MIDSEKIGGDGSRRRQMPRRRTVETELNLRCQPVLVRLREYRIPFLLMELVRLVILTGRGWEC